MKFHTIILGLCALLIAVSTTAAQNINIHTADGTTSFNLADIDSIVFTIDGEIPEPGTEREFQLTDDTSITMIWIASGDFMMGALDDEQNATDWEYPRHEVNIENGFWMGKYELTQAQWESAMGNNPSYYDGENRPVENVSRNAVTDFLEQIYDGFRLPSEAEWEYACRAGTTTRFYWGNDPDYNELGEYAVYNRNDPNGTADVGTKLPNNFGLYDMSGNVYEWCEDDYHANYNGAPQNGSPWIENPRNGTRILRGGSWYNYPERLRSAFRHWHAVHNRNRNNGLRLVRDID